MVPPLAAALGDAYGLVPPLAAALGASPFQDWFEERRERAMERRAARRAGARLGLARLKWRWRLQRQLAQNQRAQAPVLRTKPPIPRRFPPGYPRMGPAENIRQQQRYQVPPEEAMAPVADEQLPEDAAATEAAMVPESEGLPTWMYIAGALAVGGGLYYMSKQKKGGKASGGSSGRSEG